MSSRRGAGEENILAMLERDSARRTGTRISGVRLASYGAAAVLAGILAGGVAWLAWDNHKGAQELQARHDAAPAVVPQAVAPPQAPPAAAPAPVLEAPRTAVIVDESARRRDTTAASAVPLLVMLPPQEVNGAKAAPPAPPAPRAPRENVPATPSRPELAPIAAPVAARSVEKKPEKAAKPAGRPAKPAPARAGGSAKGKPEAATKARKPAPGAEAPVDSDVALISAIIQHSERHRAEREAAACNGARCPARPSPP